MMIWARRRPLLIGICLLFLAIIAGPWTVARFESNLSLLILERHVSLTAISEPTALLLDNPVPSDPALERVRMGLVDAVATHPNDARARAWIGYIDLLMGHPALALNESTAERGVPQDSMMRFRYATILAANGRSDDSRAVWGSINAGNYFAQVGAGARDHEQLELAVTADWLALDVGGLTTAVKARIYRDLGAISLFKSNEPQRALEELLTADSLQPNDISTLELLAEASFDIGNTDEALQYALSALSLDGGAANAHEVLGEIYLGREQFSPAADELQAALRLRPTDPWILTLLGDAKCRLGDSMAAQKSWSAAFAAGEVSVARRDVQDCGMR